MYYNIVLLKVRAHTDKKDKHSIANNIVDKLASEGANEKLNNKSIFTNDFNDNFNDNLNDNFNDNFNDNSEEVIKEEINNLKSFSTILPDKKYKQPKFKNLKLSSFF